jgi:elongation factor Ts
MELIKKLRERSGAGMADCKKALDESGNDLEKALEILRKKGITKAAKREGREASEGLILLAVNEADNEGYMVEVNAETDFVVRNERFQAITRAILDLIKRKKPANFEALLALPLVKGTVKEDLDELSGTIGEKMGIKNFTIVSGGSVAGYSHQGGKIGVLVVLDKPGRADLAMDVAMQIAATNPLYIDPSEVPMQAINKEKEIEREALAKEGKPAAMMEKILEGKVNKYFEANCLVKQEYIKDEKKKVCQHLGDAKIIKFVRYSLQ